MSRGRLERHIEKNMFLNDTYQSLILLILNGHDTPGKIIKAKKCFPSVVYTQLKKLLSNGYIIKGRRHFHINHIKVYTLYIDYVNNIEVDKKRIIDILKNSDDKLIKTFELIQ